VAEIHHFTYGWFNPVAALVMAYLGWFLGLVCAGRSRDGRTRGRRNRWLIIAAVSIGGAGLWLPHFVALLGIEVPASTLRFHPLLTIGSMALAVAPLGLALFLVGRGDLTVPKALGGVALLASGLLGMTYTGLLGLQVAGDIRFDLRTAGVSAAIAVVASALAVWFATSTRGWGATAASAAVVAVATCGVHYASVGALRVYLSPEPVPVNGISPFLLIVPITLVAAGTLIAMAVSALQAMTEEEFDGAVSGRHRGAQPPAQPPPAALPAAPAVPVMSQP
jgi:NO-binding membrane sensor protein with MHYT domain